MSKRRPPPHIASPEVWGAWCLVGLGWLVARLPLALLFPLGKQLGRLLFRCGGRRRRITETNLRLCFPDLGPSEVQALAGRVFESVALGVLEICVVWLNPSRDLRRRVRVEGAYLFQDALAQGRGVLLLGGHFGFEVMVTGGEFKAPTLSLTGEKAAAFFDKVHVDKLFLAAGGISFAAGLTYPGFNDIHVKRAMIASARQVYLVADSTKLGTSALAVLGGLDLIHTFITDDGIGADERAEFERRSIEVVVAAVDR